MDEFRARDLGFDEYASRAAYGDLPSERREPDLLASTLPLDAGPSDASPAGAAPPREDAPPLDDTPPRQDVPSPGDAPPREDARHGAAGRDLPSGSRRGKGARRDFGPSGTPFNRQSPFYIGF